MSALWDTESLLHPSAPHNVAAWALKPLQRPLVVSSAPYTHPPPGHVVIRVTDVAVNPIDWIQQDTNIFKATYPTVFGQDAAGTIVSVAPDVHDLAPGAKVIAHCSRQPNVKLPPSATGAFQKYVVVQAVAVAELPPSVPGSLAVVLPLALSTAAAALYPRHTLSLPFPCAGGNPTPLRRTLLVWGGSSSVGSTAIQLAVASGVEVVTTASPANARYCEELGAAAVFDYHDEGVEDAVVEWLASRKRTVAGAFHAVGADGAVQACARIVDRASGKAIVISVLPVPETGIPKSVRAKRIGASSIFEDDTGKRIWNDFLHKALDSGTIVPRPDPLVVGEELRSVQLGLDVQKRGVSASKVVIRKIS